MPGGRQGQMLSRTIAESSKRFNIITKTIQVAYLGILFYLYVVEIIVDEKWRHLTFLCLYNFFMAALQIKYSKLRDGEG